MHWQLYSQYADLSHELAKKLSISTITAQVLINRGITKADEAGRFLNPSLQQLHDPFLMSDMDKGVSRIIKAIKSGERISICGDYDADGVTSTALLLRFFGIIGVDASYHIPNRLTDGYGFHKSAVDILKKNGASLIITVDNGISAFETVDYATSVGVDVIITDHHEPKDLLPRALAVINPKKRDCKFPFKELAGVGVTFNLIMGLRQKMRERGLFKEMQEPRLRDLLDIVAIGTVADVVPLVDENRIFVKFGLEELKKSLNKGLNALKIISRVEPHQINATAIAFRLAPRINAAGRLEDQNLGVRLLTTNDPEDAASIAEHLHGLNSKRQSIEESILRETKEMISSNGAYKDSLGLTLAKDGWHRGVIGIVAARLAEEHNKPSVVISIDGGIGKGSVRSVGSYNIMNALKSCEDLLLNFGGHSHAAGVTLETANIESFKKRFAAIVASTLKEEDRYENVMVDSELEPDDISEYLIEELETLSPFGEGNPEPVFCLRELKVQDARIVAEKHLKLKFSDNMVVLNAIGFDMGHHRVESNDVLDVAFIPQRDTWRGDGAVQLKLKDLRQV